VNVGGRNYLAYMSVRHFGSPGQWITNYGGIAYSDDDGQSWVEAPSASRSNTPAFDDKFQMISFVSAGRLRLRLRHPEWSFRAGVCRQGARRATA
jgi:hypothetical protein